MLTPRFFSSVGARVLAPALALALAGCARDRAPAAPASLRGEGRLLSARPFDGVPFAIAELGLELRPVPAGSFRMGSPGGEPGRTGAEEPATTVTLSRPFWLGRTPVTHAQWRAVMGTDLAAQAQKAVPGNPDIAGFLAGSDENVAMHLVTWSEAVAFCEKLNERARAEDSLPAGYEFSLPTEAQWEYACRAGTTGATYADSVQLPGRLGSADLEEIAWFAGNSSAGYAGPAWDTENGGPAGPRRVGLKAPNAWGFYDMLGNVYQWCRDYSATSLPGGQVTDPTGPMSGADRIVRGGCWHSPPAFCRAAYRAWSSPEGRSQYIGFRLALTPKPGR